MKIRLTGGLPIPPPPLPLPLFVAPLLMMLGTPTSLEWRQVADLGGYHGAIRAHNG